VSPDGKLLYVPQLGPMRAKREDGWLVIDAETGNIITKLASENTRGAHNTIYTLDGSRVFMGALNSRYMNIADTKTHTIAQTVGPFGTEKDMEYAGGAGRGVIRPFTINGKGTIVYVCVMGLLGFEVGDVQTGKVIHRVDLSAQFPWTRQDLHGEGFPSHGIALSPDEKELWLTDNVYGMLHVFDVTVMPPKQITSVTLPGKSRLAPGEVLMLAYPYWISFSLDGKYVFPSTGDVIDAKTKRVVTTLTDEHGRPVRSEKVVQVLWQNGKPVRVTDQFGVGLLTGDGPRSTAARD
jgi:DNA-binding beta-propeller fold protein YncE